MSLDDSTAILLEGIAESLDRQADLMQTAARAFSADGRSILKDTTQGVADGLRLAAEHCREVAVTPADQRGLVAATLVLLTPNDVADSPYGLPLEVRDGRR